MLLRCVVLLPVIGLLGCGEAAYLSYQGRPAETALECEAAYEAAQDRSRNVPVGTDRGSLIGAALGRGMVEASMKSAYDQCLARVATLPGGGSRVTAASPRASTTARGPSCEAGGGVLQGGTGYCMR
ncbi:MAG: hypothetical protein J0L76_18615 [Rhodobacterales bacterium]|nr:hypothetical protein [Rhodobacterales bacterium]